MLTAELDQSKLPPAARLSGRALQELLDTVGKALPKKAGGELSIAFVSEQAIRRINKTYRKKDKVTDVLAFEFPLGEVLICYSQAKRQAAERGHTVKQEVLDLLIHGILHVFGYDHEKPKDAKLMLPLQAKIFRKLYASTSR